MTYVRTRLALDKLQTGQVLAVRLRGAEPAANVPLTAAQQGHHVLSQDAQEDGSVIIRLQRA